MQYKIRRRRRLQNDFPSFRRLNERTNELGKMKKNKKKIDTQRKEMTLKLTIQFTSIYPMMMVCDGDSIASFDPLFDNVLYIHYWRWQSTSTHHHLPYHSMSSTLLSFSTQPYFVMHFHFDFVFWVWVLCA